MASQKTISPKNPMRRRSRPRKGTQDSVINVAEARREIAFALHLHRTSSSPSPSSSATESPCSSIYGCDLTEQVVCGPSSPYCYPLMESMPIPGPVWSTTAPSVLARNNSGSAAVASASSLAKEVLGFEWGESQELEAASYSWWFGFLKTLDDANYNAQDSKYSLGNTLLTGSGFDKIGEQVGCVGENDHQSPSPDEWLLFPTPEDESPIP